MVSVSLSSSEAASPLFLSLLFSDSRWRRWFRRLWRRRLGRLGRGCGDGRGRGLSGFGGRRREKFRLNFEETMIFPAKLNIIDAFSSFPEVWEFGWLTHIFAQKNRINFANKKNNLPSPFSPSLSVLVGNSRDCSFLSLSSFSLYSPDLSLFLSSPFSSNLLDLLIWPKTKAKKKKYFFRWRRGGWGIHQIDVRVFSSCRSRTKKRATHISFQNLGENFLRSVDSTRSPTARNHSWKVGHWETCLPFPSLSSPPPPYMFSSFCKP